jgi:hypothetical protein
MGMVIHADSHVQSLRLILVVLALSHDLILFFSVGRFSYFRYFSLLCFSGEFPSSSV